MTMMRLLNFHLRPYYYGRLLQHVNTALQSTSRSCSDRIRNLSIRTTPNIAITTSSTQCEHPKNNGRLVRHNNGGRERIQDQRSYSSRSITTIITTSRLDLSQQQQQQVEQASRRYFASDDSNNNDNDPFASESAYHTVADQTLEDIQDAVELALEDSSTVQPFDITYASGVLTMVLPLHGTWVLNKQTPNRQIWWSSPLSGPRRYEYDPDTKEWVYTRDEQHSLTLRQSLRDEFRQLYGDDGIELHL